MKRTMVLLVVLAVAGTADALPRYAARYGQSCILCHDNLSGGGLRTSYAGQFLVPTELAATAGEEAFDPEIAPGVRVGGDLRVLVSRTNDDRDLLLVMQSDFYVGADLDDRISFQWEQTRAGLGEAYGAARVLPRGGHVRAGRLEPAYGWRFADHQLPARRHLLAPDGANDPARLLADGVELGWRPLGLDVQAGLFGGGDHGDSHAVRVAGWRRLAGLNVALGVSTLRRAGFGTPQRATAGFGAVARGRLAWLWQVDESRDGGERGRAVTHQASLNVRRGVDLVAGYGFQDPDRDRETGMRERWSLAVDALLTPHAGVLVQGVREDPTPGPRVEAVDRWRGEAVLHVLF
ncbi:MAG TPA: hypothetical protein P5571_12655 [Candidatus Krumholzibacteria bacterium]|mgnify:CR=1 FL=1|nr:hypothetical protein [Candidatus Krumholzibacteria bacterium]HRX52212.1 hypothetical protein [Candidatus Krumholzibacteria bacterium]